MVPVDKEYRFDGPDGEVTLPDLFDGRRQLITYRFFFDEDVSGWPDAGCEGCSMFTDGVTHLAHLHARDVTMVLLSPAPPDKLPAYAQRMGWNVPSFTIIGDEFSADFGVSEYFGINVFLRDGDDVYRTYFLEGPAVEGVGNVWSLLELTPFGRQQKDEDSPEGWPQDPPYSWIADTTSTTRAASGGRRAPGRWRRSDEWRGTSRAASGSPSMGAGTPSG